MLAVKLFHSFEAIIVLLAWSLYHTYKDQASKYQPEAVGYKCVSLATFHGSMIPKETSSTLNTDIDVGLSAVTNVLPPEGIGVVIQ